MDARRVIARLETGRRVSPGQGRRGERPEPRVVGGPGQGHPSSDVRGHRGHVKADIGEQGRETPVRGGYLLRLQEGDSVLCHQHSARAKAPLAVGIELF